MIDLLINLTDFHSFHLIHLLFQSLIAGILFYLVHHLPNSKVNLPKDAFDQSGSHSHDNEMHYYKK